MLCQVACIVSLLAVSAFCVCLLCFLACFCLTSCFVSLHCLLACSPSSVLLRRLRSSFGPCALESARAQAQKVPAPRDTSAHKYTKSWFLQTPHAAGVSVPTTESDDVEAEEREKQERDRSLVQQERDRSLLWFAGLFCGLQVTLVVCRSPFLLSFAPVSLFAYHGALATVAATHLLLQLQQLICCGNASVLWRLSLSSTGTRARGSCRRACAQRWCTGAWT